MRRKILLKKNDNRDIEMSAVGDCRQKYLQAPGNPFVDFREFL